MKILYCEDYRIFHEIVRNCLTEIPIITEITEADNGKTALLKLQKETFDLVITGLRMPEMNGFELLKEVRQKWPSLPVLVFSSYDTSLVGKELMELGAWGYVSKRNHISELFEAVKTILDGEKYYSEELKSLMKAPTKLSKKKK